MKRLLTHTQLKHTKQAANRFLTCSIAVIMAIALSLPAAGIPTLSFADEPKSNTVTVTPVDLEDNGGSVSASDSGNASSNNEKSTSGDSPNISTAEGSSDNSGDSSSEANATGDSDKQATFNGQDGYTYIPGEGMIAPSSDLQPPTSGEDGISAASINSSDPAQMQVLIDNRFTGLNPANTTVNLYDYSSFKDANGNDEQYNSTNPANWFNGSNNINTNHALTFGNGMSNDMGYWNAGSGSGMGVFSGYTPGFQNIVSSVLGDDGYPMLSEDSMVVQGGGTEYVTTTSGDGWMTQPLTSWPEVGGYDANPPLYRDAKRYGNSDFPLASWATPGALLFPNAGGKNISSTVQNQWNKDRSLDYLFDTSAEASSAPGRTETHEDVKGLFQLDDQGYYYYNMRDNFAQYTATEVEGRDGTTIPANSFILYDAPAGLRTTGGVGNFFPFNTGEQVFKVENGKLVSDIYASNGSRDNSGNAPANTNLGEGKPLVDHHLGMSMETSFRQPIDGKVGSNDMTFEFVGDDDLWIFVDDVLVLDLGGIHSELYGTINFATGEVDLGTAFKVDAEGNSVKADPVRTTTIKEMFEAAGKADDVRWNGDTFASSTSHTLKMFYFERGNYDSSLALKFNLQPALYQQVKKVDQNGNPLAGAEFDLYEVNVPEGTNAQNAQDVTLDQVSIKGDPLTHIVTDQNGEAKFVSKETLGTDNEEPFNFSDRYDGGSEGLIYILRETKAPPGYKAVPTDLLLRFNPQNTMLIVNNRYQTGSYASFNSYVTGNNGSVFYGQIGEDGGQVTKIPDDELVDGATANVPIDSQRYGLVVAIPMLKQSSYNSERAWFPLYGDNLVGFKTVHMGDLNAEYEQYRRDVRTSTLTAALMQAAEHYRSDHHYDDAHTEGWHLDWNEETSRLEGTLQNLPGRADRYILTNPDGDMRMFYAVIEPDALARVLGVSEDEVRAMSTTERYDALGRVAMSAVDADNGAPGDQIASLVSTINPNPELFQDRGYSALDISQFIRNFRTLLYIPNEQRQLRVTKIDQNGVAKNGAEFALYTSEDDAKNDTNRAASGRTATVDGADGMLIFEPLQSHESAEPGYADIAWPNVSFEGGAATYYLKETQAPAGCNINDTIIPVKVGVYSIYADAGTPEDNVSVSAGVGKLTQTMVQFAAEGDVNITLRDITSFAQSQPSGSFGLQDWEDVYLTDTGSDKIPRSMNLHYGQNAVVDYGLSDEDGGKNIQPFFVTDTGYMRARVQQNLHEHDDPNDPQHSEANADDLGDMDITSLFSLINTVIVTDTDPNAQAAGDLSISKKVEGATLAADQYDRLFHFTLRIYDQNGNELPNTQRYYFYGKDRVGFIGSGDEIPLHHDEDLVVMGIPEGYTYKVVETDADQGGLFVSPIGGTIEGKIQKDAVLEAAFVNSQEKPKEPDNPDNPDNPEGPGDPGSSDEPGGPGSDGEGSFLENMGDSIPYVLVVIALVAAGAAVLVKRRGDAHKPLGKHGG